MIDSRRNLSFVLTPWMIVNIVFAWLVYITHRFYATTTTFSIGTPEHLYGLAKHQGFPELMLLTAILLFFATLLGELADRERSCLWGIPARTVLSVGFSGLSLLYTGMVFVSLWAMG